MFKNFLFLDNIFYLPEVTIGHLFLYGRCQTETNESKCVAGYVFNELLKYFFDSEFSKNENISFLRNIQNMYNISCRPSHLTVHQTYTRIPLILWKPWGHQNSWNHKKRKHRKTWKPEIIIWIWFVHNLSNFWQISAFQTITMYISIYGTSFQYWKFSIAWICLWKPWRKKKLFQYSIEDFKIPLMFVSIFHLLWLDVELWSPLHCRKGLLCWPPVNGLADCWWAAASYSVCSSIVLCSSISVSTFGLAP